MRNLKLRPLILSVLILGILFPVLIAGWMTIRYQQETLYHELEKDHIRIVNFLSLAMQEPIWTLVPETGAPLVMALMADNRITSVIIESDDAILLEQHSSQNSGGELITRNKKINYYGKEIGSVTVTIDTGQIWTTTLSQSKRLLLIFLIPFFFSILVLFLILHRKILKPLEILIGQSEALAVKNLQTPFIWRQHDEMGLLGHSLEQTRKSLHLLFSNLEQLNNKAIENATVLADTNLKLEKENRERQKVEKELLEYKRQLEEMIKLRTSELVSTNKTLLKEIEERKKAENERRQFELKLHHAEKMEALGELASGVAHDLNNILAGIVSYPELLLLKLEKNSVLRRPLEEIQDAGQRAAIVVADLLTIARSAATILTPHNLEKLVSEYLSSPECLQLQSSFPEISIVFTPDTENPSILCSPVHVKKCIMNLITNAVEASEKSGTIQVKICCNREDEKSSESPKRMVTLSITDSGPGIPTKDIQHIFEPFYSTKQMGMSGSGLGLAVVWNTMQEHKGKVFVESSIKGSRFDLIFLRENDDNIEQARTPPVDAFQGNGETILVVDDEPLLLNIALAMLTEMGYRVNTASSGEDALEYLRGNEVDLVLLDMVMEPGINGVQTYEQILTFHPNQKAIIVSGFSINDEIRAALTLGVSLFVKKPYSMQQIGEAVQRALA